MFVGSRNFGVSESGVESYLNEPGGIHLYTCFSGTAGGGGEAEKRR